MEKIFDMMTANEFATMFSKIAENGNIKVNDDHVSFITDNDDNCIYVASIYFDGRRLISVMDIKVNRYTVHHFNSKDLFTTIESVYS